MVHTALNCHQGHACTLYIRAFCSCGEKLIVKLRGPAATELLASADWVLNLTARLSECTCKLRLTYWLRQRMHSRSNTMSSESTDAAVMLPAQHEEDKFQHRRLLRTRPGKDMQHRAHLVEPCTRSRSAGKNMQIHCCTNTADAADDRVSRHQCWQEDQPLQSAAPATWHAGQAQLAKGAYQHHTGA